MSNPKVVYLADYEVRQEVKELARRGIISCVKWGDTYAVARYGVNKTTLLKLLKKRQKEIGSNG